MSQITCAISGIKFRCEFCTSLAIPHTEGYYHPIFVAPYSTLHKMYSLHCKGQLTSTDSYLLFIAFLHSSDAIRWKSPAACNPNNHRTKQLVENNLSLLIAVLEKSNVIRHPNFKQPKFKVTFDNNNMLDIPNWIKAWDANIKAFKLGRIDLATQELLQQVENKLSYMILSGEDPIKFSAIIASWADKAAIFPEEHAELWKRTIRSTFSITKMFNTPLVLLKEIKNYCELNIEAGSIHFHTLSKVLSDGIARHSDYLGGSSLALGYTLLSPEEAKNALVKNTAALEVIASKAPEHPPIRADYDSQLSFLRAKLAYRVVLNKAAAAAAASNEENSDDST